MKFHNSKLLLALVAGNALLHGAAVSAEEGWYIGINGGNNNQQSQDLKQRGMKFVQANFDDDLDSSYSISLVAGRELASGLRPELEVSYRRAGLESFGSRVWDGGGSIDGGGSETALSLMANLWYDFKAPSGLFSVVHPMIGAGVGISDIKARSLSAGGVPFGSPSDTSTSFQVGGGFGYEASKALGVSLTYRYFEAEAADFGTIQNLPPGNVAGKFESRSVMLEVRYAFSK